MTVPYTYLLKHKPTGHLYYGVRWKKGCHPDEFWKTYFTSSKKLIPLYRTIYGDDCWEFEIRRTFKTGKEASAWESKVLRRMNVLKKPELWLNRTTNSAWLYDKHPHLGKAQPHTAEMNRRPDIIEKRRAHCLVNSPSKKPAVAKKIKDAAEQRYNDPKWFAWYRKRRSEIRLPPKTDKQTRSVIEANQRRYLEKGYAAIKPMIDATKKKVYCEGVIYNSMVEANRVYGKDLHSRWNNPRWPEFYRLEDK